MMHPIVQLADMIMWSSGTLLWLLFLGTQVIPYCFLFHVYHWTDCQDELQITIDCKDSQCHCIHSQFYKIHPQFQAIYTYKTLYVHTFSNLPYGTKAAYQPKAATWNSTHNLIRWKRNQIGTKRRLERMKSRLRRMQLKKRGNTWN
jgi:hypothetical protein